MNEGSGKIILSAAKTPRSVGQQDSLYISRYHKVRQRDGVGRKQNQPLDGEPRQRNIILLELLQK